MKIKRYIKDNMGYIIVVGLFLFIIMQTTIKIGKYQHGIIMSLIVFIIMLLLKNNELKKNLSKSEQLMIDLLKGLEEKGLIRGEKYQPKEKDEQPGD